MLRDLVKYRQLIENMPDAFAYYQVVLNNEHVPVNSIFLEVNKAYEAMMGLSRDQVIGKKVTEVYPDIKESPFDWIGAGARIAFGETTRFEKHFERAGKWYGLTAYSDEPGYVAVVFRDITEFKQVEEKLRHISFHDGLTGLYNRTYMEEEMKRIDTPRQLPISVIISDLNGLKLVNDTYGHNVGDKMLKYTAHVLTSSCRKEDLIARWGGDEFVILLPRTTKTKTLGICKRISDTCSSTYVVDIPISLSLGVEVKEGPEVSLKDVLKAAENDMYQQKLNGSRNAKNAVLNSLLKTLGTISCETREHTRRMSEVALKIGKKIDLPDSELTRLGILTSLHDIGKIKIPKKVLTKKEALTGEEWEMIRKHPEVGYRIARSMEEFSHVAEDILAHHERWDGSGYPLGLKGNKIPLLARIMAIADAYEVMTNGRPYREALSPKEAIAELKRCAGTHFDPKLVEVFLLLQGRASYDDAG